MQIALTTGTTSHISDLESQLAAEREQAAAILATLEHEGRQDEPTEDERRSLEGHLTKGKTLKAQLAQLRQTRFNDRVLEVFGGGEFPAGTLMRGGHRSLGAQFVASEAWTYLRSTRHNRPAQWHSPAVDLHAETLTETGSPIVAPQYLPGVVPSATAPVVMSDLFAKGTVTSNAIVYMKETLYTNAATAVAEANAKPESTIRFAPVTEPLHKIAHYLPVSEEMLEDEAQMRSYLDARLRLGVELELDDQILNGDGVAPNMLGLLVRTDLAPDVPAAGNGLDSIAEQIAAIEAAQQLRVDGIVLNASDWVKLGLLKTVGGEYLSGSPFTQSGPSQLFGRRVAITPMIPQGTALVGAFATGGGQLFLHGGIRTAASNSHSDYFIRNLVAIRAEVRAALAVFRSGAFGKVTGLNPVTP